MAKAKEKKTPNQVFMELVNQEETLTHVQFFVTGYGYGKLKGSYSTKDVYFNPIAYRSKGYGYHFESHSITHAISDLLKGFFAKRAYKLINEFISLGRPESMLSSHGELKTNGYYIWVTDSVKGHGHFSKNSNLEDVTSVMMSTAGAGTECVISAVKEVGLYLLERGVYIEDSKEKHFELIVPKPIIRSNCNIMECVNLKLNSTFDFYQYGKCVETKYGYQDALNLFDKFVGEVKVIERESKDVVAYKLEGGK